MITPSGSKVLSLELFGLINPIFFKSIMYSRSPLNVFIDMKANSSPHEGTPETNNILSFANKCP